MMRLLTWTDDEKLKFHEFEGVNELPAYAVLSHTWHTNNKEEVTYEDLETGSGEHKAGYRKIEFCRKQASVDKLAFFWIDTCCINRRSEVELSEAINSMFRWYKNATRCYVYLPDVYTSREERDTPSCGNEWEALFPQSRWFTRGWTLQELIAPGRVDFFGRDGTHLGNKSTLGTTISNITGISPDVLHGRPLAECTIEERMTWAKTRTTKREEDHVYSMLGIFDVTMPLVYGEGKEKAFRRLHDEISKYTPLHVGFAVDTSCNDATQELILLRSALQKLEARLTTSLIARGNSVGLQGSSSMPATYQSIFDHEQRHTAAINAVEIATKSAGTNHPHFLRKLLIKLTQLLCVFAAPLGCFETWSSFQPEAYTIYDIGAQIVCYSLIPAEKHPTIAIVMQDLWVAKTQRHWIRIRLRITVATGTTHWKLVVEQNLNPVSYIGERPLPNNVDSLVQKVIAEHPDVDDDTEINICFDKDSDTTSRDSNPRATSLTQMLDTSITDTSWNRTESLRHQNVRIIPDAALVTAFAQGVCMVANLDNRWVGYRTATAGKYGMDLLWRAVQAGIALREASHVAQLVGVTVGSKNNLLKGMLVELPTKGPMFRLMDTHRFKLNPIPWPRRQKWAKQIVRGVAAYHARCQVLAGIRTYNWCVSINDRDNAVILGYFHGSHPSVYRGGGLLPPECRIEDFGKGDGQVGPEFDVFQLGLLLWHLYRDQNQQNARTFCSLAGCKNAELGACNEHGDPIALPKAAADVPEYLDRIIALCRQKDPCKRPAAWELIHMFPKDEEILEQIDLLNIHENVISRDCGGMAASATLKRLEVVRALYGSGAICSFCGEYCRDGYYKCEVCKHGNYDLCHKCFVEGRHCWNGSHMLVRFMFESLANRESLNRATYFSSVNEKGEREEVVI